MQVRWATNEKAMMASDKHFNGDYSANEMTNVVKALLKKITHTGVSDRSNGRYPPAKIVWATYQGSIYAMVICSKDLAKGMITIVSFYDVNPKTVDVKASRFGMKKVVR